jgi:hypothetical protein
MIGPTQPEGPGSSIEGKASYPEVHVGFEDGLAHAQWARRRASRWTLTSAARISAFAPSADHSDALPMLHSVVTNR